VSQTLDRLIYMANQIARNLATHTDPPAAVADHIAHFWDPRMKEQIYRHLLAGGAGLDTVALAALRTLAAGVEPRPQTLATAAEGGSDAG
jgi:formate dehydrogenase subunit delta